MKSKNLIVGLVVAAIVVISILFVAKPFTAKKEIKKNVPAAKGRAAKPVVPIKKAFAKDMGGLTVKILDSKNRDMVLRVRAFKSIDSRFSTYAASFTSNIMQELAPGSYDIEIDTIPQMIHKGISVSKGKETVQNLGHLTGSINVKALNAKKKDASFPVRILYAKSNITAASTSTNRPIEIAPGVYDIEIGTLPAQSKKDIKLDAGKEAALDIGCTTGNLVVKALDENKKEVRYSTRIKKAGTGEIVTSSTSNRLIEILQGTYDVEVLSSPVQAKSDVKVAPGEEASVEFLVQAPPAPVKAAVPAKTKK